MAKTTYQVVEPIRHDGEDLPVGAKVALDKDAAKAPLEAGVIVEAKPAAKGA